MRVKRAPWVLGATIAVVYGGCFGKGFDLSPKDGGAGAATDAAASAGAGGTTTGGRADASSPTEATHLGGNPGTGGSIGTGGATTSAGNGGAPATGGATVLLSAGGSGGRATGGTTITVSAGGSGGTSAGGTTVVISAGTGGATASGGKNGTASTGGSGTIGGLGGTMSGGRGGTVSTRGTGGAIAGTGGAGTGGAGTGGAGTGGATVVAECSQGAHRCGSDNKSLFTCTAGGVWPATGTPCPGGQCSGTACNCVTQGSANLVPGGGFDSATSDWVSRATEQGVSASRATLDSSGCSSSGSLLFTAVGSPQDTLQKYVQLKGACVSLGSSASYDMGAWIYAPSGLAGFANATFQVDWYSDAACQNLKGDSSNIYFARLSVDACKSSAACGLQDSYYAAYKGLPSDDWVYLHLDGIVPPAGTTALDFNLLVATQAGGGTAKAYFDSLYFAPSPGHF